MSFVNAVTIPRLALSNVPAAEKSVHVINRNFEGGNVWTTLSINDSDSGEFREGVSDEHQEKKNLETKRQISFQEEALYLETTKINP